jgi:hypothetical protein
MAVGSFDEPPMPSTLLSTPWSGGLPPYRRDVWQEDGYQGVQELFAVMAGQYDIPIMRRFSPSTGAFPPHSRPAQYTHAA